MTDMTVPCGNGVLNIRVGAIILNDNKIMMATNSNVDYLYSIGGRIKFGENAEEAVKREVREELGVELEVDKLGIVHENYFFSSIYGMKRLVYEISFYFYMKNNGSCKLDINRINNEEEKKESFVWVDSGMKRKMHPDFLFEYLDASQKEVIHIYTDERTVKKR